MLVSSFRGFNRLCQLRSYGYNVNNKKKKKKKKIDSMAYYSSV